MQGCRSAGRWVTCVGSCGQRRHRGYQSMIASVIGLMPASLAESSSVSPRRSGPPKGGPAAGAPRPAEFRGPPGHSARQDAFSLNDIDHPTTLGEAADATLIANAPRQHPLRQHNDQPRGSGSLVGDGHFAVQPIADAPDVYDQAVGVRGEVCSQLAGVAIQRPGAAWGWTSRRLSLPHAWDEAPRRRVIRGRSALCRRGDRPPTCRSGRVRWRRR